MALHGPGVQGSADPPPLRIDPRDLRNRAVDEYEETASSGIRFRAVDAVEKRFQVRGKTPVDESRTQIAPGALQVKPDQ